MGGPRGKTRTGGVILAAGRSSRFGETKQLVALDSKPMLQHVIDAANASRLDQLVIVLGHDAAAVLAQIKPGRAIVILNDQYKTGLASSVNCGLAAVAEASDGVLFLLGDQPAVTTTLIDRLIDAFEGSDLQIMMPAYDGVPGNPALFGKALFPAFASLQGDEGARSIIQANRPSVRLIPVSDAAPGLDVDTEADRDALLDSWRRQGGQGP